ncbi:hypothetical protein AF72_05265 [Xylella taiwanensis]|uniref:Uncharacterized protein n=1 Tax=Xylella taiwanensis TaxID=1444770 RepID=Z9JKH8_9GAMM|nr:hypothetical protein AF72_05265 [Xylella taiwanensis]
MGVRIGISVVIGVAMQREIRVAIELPDQVTWLPSEA